MSFSPHRQFSTSVLLAPLVFAALTGCRGRAQRDMYQAKMAHEIRVLEDQLYEADYHNRVLVDKLEQVRLKSAPANRSGQTGSHSIETVPTPVPTRNPDSGDSTVPIPIRDPLPDAGNDLSPPELPEFDAGDISTEDSPDNVDRGPKRTAPPSATPNVNDLHDLDSMIDAGELVDPTEVDAPEATDPFADDPKVLGDGATDGAKSEKKDDEGLLLPAPGGPEPPSRRDTEIPPVLPGEILPPSTLDAEEDKPPGQIDIPDSARDGSGVPDQLRLHPSLSGGHRVDGEIESMMIVVNILDRLGRPLELTRFDVEAELSVVLYDTSEDDDAGVADDPNEDESDESRIGRWDFSADQVLELVKSDPISGLHIPIQWNGRQPKGENIVVHIRLRSEEDEMRCEGRLRVEKANAVATWTPRGDSRK